jgi:1,4-dihydroxy-2-naphthoate octaprenyltransferase
MNRIMSINNKSIWKIHLDQKEDRRLAVFRLGPPTGSLLTQLSLYRRSLAFVTPVLLNFYDICYFLPEIGEQKSVRRL